MIYLIGSQSGVSSHVNGQGFVTRSIRAGGTRYTLIDPPPERWELLGLHPHNLADDSEEPLSAHAAREPLDEGREAPSLGLRRLIAWLAVAGLIVWSLAMVGAVTLVRAL